MGVVKQLADYRPSLEAVERQVADLDDGYTRTANALMEAVMLSGLTQHQLLIVIAVWRKTYGYNKKMDWIGNEQFAALTGMAPTKCSTAKNELVRMGVLTQTGRQVGMNKNISEWKTKVNGIGKTFTESVKKTFTKTVKSDLPNQVNTKDNIQKTERKDPPKSPKGECGGQEEKPVSQKKPAIDYQAVLSAYNSTLGDRLPQAEAINDKRRRGIKRLLSELKEPTVEAVENYFSAFSRTAKPFYFGENDTGWRASFDYLLRSETLVKTREGSL